MGDHRIARHSYPITNRQYTAYCDILKAFTFTNLYSKSRVWIFVAWQTCAYRRSWYGMFHCFAFVRRVILYVLSCILMGLYSKLVSILFRSSIPFDSYDMIVLVQMSMILIGVWFFFFSWKPKKHTHTRSPEHGSIEITAGTAVFTDFTYSTIHLYVMWWIWFCFRRNDHFSSRFSCIDSGNV